MIAQRRGTGMFRPAVAILVRGFSISCSSLTIQRAVSVWA